MAVLLSVFAGIVTWSFLEYVIHRWAGHDRRLAHNVFEREHTAHHSRGNYFAPTWKKAGTAVLTAAVLIGPAVALAGWVLGASYVAGLVGFYLYYEALHRLEHVHGGLWAYGRWARKHHFYHHFHDPSVNHGVTSPVWDWVFGTWVSADVIRVPEKLVMPWLIGDDGEVREDFTGDYVLRRKKAA